MFTFHVITNNVTPLIGSDFCEAFNVVIDYKRIKIFMASSVKTGNSQSSGVVNLVEDFQEVFAQDTADVGLISGCTHKIDCGDHPPITQKAYRISQKERDIVDELMEDMMSQGIIVPSRSPWSSPVVLVPKKEGTTRFCVDYRKLNNVTKDDPHPIPRIEDGLDLLEECVKFSKPDVAAMYWHIAMDPHDQPKTAFIVHQGLFEFTRMPFELKGAPSMAMRAINDVLAGLNLIKCFVYFDDILVFGKSEKEHDDHLNEVLARLIQRNSKWRKEKYSFGLKSVSYLGYDITASGMLPDQRNLAAIQNIKPPMDVAGVRPFLGPCTTYRKFIENFSKKAAPINDSLKKDVPFHWGPEQEESFRILKTSLTEPPVLVPLDDVGELKLRTDTSHFGLGAVLMQKMEDSPHPVCYISRTLSPAGKNYEVTEKECLAIVWAITKLRFYLYGQNFTVVMDHCGLCWFKSVRDPTARLARWAVKLQPFTFDVK